jgi:hypothetical protein
MAKDKIPMPFFTRDWLSCAEVKVLAPDVRGLWFDMICYMWESVERGVMVKPNHQPYTKDEITLMIGRDCSGSYAWFDTLIDNGVCAVREDGAIYSRRMVKDEEIRGKRREAGKKGGDVTKAKVFQPKQETVDGSPDDATQTPPPLTPEQQEKAEKAKKYKYADYVTLTRDEYAKLCEEYSEDGAKAMIDILNNYKGSKGKKYKSDYLTIRGWVKDKYYEDLQKNGSERTLFNGGTGSQNNKAVSGSGVQTNSKESSGGNTGSQKNYSERF